MNPNDVRQTQAWRPLSLAVALALAAPLFNPAHAQQREEGASGMIEEVTVTARRREESLLEVPISVTAFTGAQLERAGLETLVDISKTTPNTTLEVSRGTNTTLTAFIRGVGQQDPVPGFEAGVGLYLDDVYLNRPQGAVLDIYDVERIEVLRGPQGTLYGRNTIGGAIKYVTRPLSQDSEFRAKLSVGSHSQADLVLSGSTPLSDTFRVGASIASLNRDGFGDNLNIPGVENYNKDVLAGRLTAEWDATPDLFFRFTADTVDDDSDPRQGHRLIPGLLSGAPVLSDVYDTRSGLNFPTQYLEADGYSLVAEWTVNDRLTIKNILADRDDEYATPIDFDSLPAADLDVPGLYANEQFSEELQFLFNGDNWDAVVGLYYLDATAFVEFDVLLATTGDLIGLPGLNAYTLGNVETDTWSVFGDFTYDFSDEWSFSFGGRYTDDERSSRVLRETYIGGNTPRFGGNPTLIATTSDFRGSETFSEFTPRAAVSWTPNDDQNLYFSYSEGFKGGSFDPRGQTSGTPDFNGDGVISEDEVFDYMKFEPEFVETFEIGLKSSLLGGRMTSSLAVFFSDYTDVQIPGSQGVDTDGDGISDTFAGITTNASDAEISGLEWEGRAILANDLGTSGSELALAWTFGYVDAEYKEYILNGVDISDQRVFQNTPEKTASATLSYDMPVSMFGMSGSLAFINTVSHRDEHSQFEIPSAIDQDTYTLWDLSVVWEDDGGHWRAGLHGRNLTDEEYKVAGYFFLPPFTTLGLEGTATAFYGDPRTVTATVEYRWF